MSGAVIRAIVFDCYGVFYVDHSKLLIPQAPADQQDNLRYLRDRASKGQISEDDFVRAEAAALGRSFEDLRSYLDHDIVRDQAVLDYAESLRKSYKVGLLSNISKGTMDSYFTPAERQQYFDAVVLSGDVGMMKPQPEIFRLMCDKLQVSPEEAIMIDDSSTNCEGARSIGMRVVLYTTLQDLQKQIAAMLHA